MRVTEDMRRRAVDALDACRHSGQPWFKLLANEVVEIALNAALAPWRTNTTSSFRPSDEEAKPEADAEKDHECDYTGPDDCCHICGADRPPEPGTLEAAERELEDCYRAAVGSGAEPRKPGDAAAAVRELAKQYDELVTAFPWRERGGDLKYERGGDLKSS